MHAKKKMPMRKGKKPMRKPAAATSKRGNSRTLRQPSDRNKNFPVGGRYI